MAQFSVNAQPLRSVQELQVPREVGRPLRGRRQQGQRAEAHDRGRRAPRGRRPVDSSRKSPGRDEVRGDHARARRHARHASSSSGPTRSGTSASGLGAEVSLKDFRKDLIIELYNEAGQLVLAYKVFRCWVSEYQALPDLDANANAVAIQTHQAGERGLGARLRGDRAHRAVVHRTLGPDGGCDRALHGTGRRRSSTSPTLGMASHRSRGPCGWRSWRGRMPRACAMRRSDACTPSRSASTQRSQARSWRPSRRARPVRPSSSSRSMAMRCGGWTARARAASCR